MYIIVIKHNTISLQVHKMLKSLKKGVAAEVGQGLGTQGKLPWK